MHRGASPTSICIFLFQQHECTIVEEQACLLLQMAAQTVLIYTTIKRSKTTMTAQKCPEILKQVLNFVSLTWRVSLLVCFLQYQAKRLAWKSVSEMACILCRAGRNFF